MSVSRVIVRRDSVFLLSHPFITADEVDAEPAVVINLIAADKIAGGISVTLRHEYHLARYRR